MAVASNVLLIVADGGLEARGRWAISPRVRKQFTFDFSLPAGWEIASVTDPDGGRCPFERYGSAAQAGRVHVRLPRAVPPGVEYCVNFRAVRTPPGWLADWKSFAVELPVFSIVGASRDEGAVAVQGRDDMTVQPQRLDGLVPLGRERKGENYFFGPGRPVGLSLRQSPVCGEPDCRSARRRG